MVVFYILVLGIGIWASVKSKKMEKNTLNGQIEVSFLANRRVSLAVGVFTMTATWVGGAFIIGVAEFVYDPTKGLIWALLPLQMSVSFVIGGLFFAKPMRDKNYTTMMDPFQRKYGKTLTGLLAVVPFISEVMWVPVTLISLATSIFTTSIYKAIRHQASDRELQWVIRFSIVILGIVGTSLTYLDDNIMTFWILSSDLTYTIMLPQLICVLFIRVSNSYGAVAGFIVAFVMRVLCGEPVFNLPVILHFPGCTLEDGVYVQRSPFKTICMLSALVSIPMFSYVASLLFNHGIVPERWDVFKVKPQGAPTPEDDARDCDEPMLDTRC
uniref:High-affinity choline transporter 1 n=1 Tax=Larimichthys crocea TaxID=215358 RepID=A0A0F8BTR8_LARCR